MTKKKQRATGVSYYQQSGLPKKILIHLPKALHTNLKKLAKQRGESLQVMARDLIQRGVEKEKEA
jgi:hypothetical protein